MAGILEKTTNQSCNRNMLNILPRTIRTQSDRRRRMCRRILAMVIGVGILLRYFMFCADLHNTSAVLIHQGNESSASSGTNWHGWSKVEKLFIFGDSWSDTGFDWGSDARPSAAEPLGNPSLADISGRFIKAGAKWPQHLTLTHNQSAIQTANFARSGATIDRLLSRNHNPDLHEQVRQGFLPRWVEYDSDISYRNRRKELRRQRVMGRTAATLWTSSNSLFTIFIGINDVHNLHTWGNETDVLQREQIKAYGQLLEMLYITGARNFLILNVPDLGRVPAGNSKSTELSISFNHRLHTLLTSFREAHPASSGTSVIEFNTFEFMNAVMDHPKHFAETSDLKVTDKYCEHYAGKTDDLELFDDRCEKSKLGQYLLQDSLHPTTIFQEALSAEVARKLQGLQPRYEMIRSSESTQTREALQDNVPIEHNKIIKSKTIMYRARIEAAAKLKKAETKKKQLKELRSRPKLRRPKKVPGGDHWAKIKQEYQDMLERDGHGEDGDDLDSIPGSDSTGNDDVREQRLSLWKSDKHQSKRTGKGSQLRRLASPNNNDVSPTNRDPQAPDTEQNDQDTKNEQDEEPWTYKGKPTRGQHKAEQEPLQTRPKQKKKHKMTGRTGNHGSRGRHDIAKATKDDENEKDKKDHDKSDSEGPNTERDPDRVHDTEDERKSDAEDAQDAEGRKDDEAPDDAKNNPKEKIAEEKESQTKGDDRSEAEDPKLQARPAVKASKLTRPLAKSGNDGNNDDEMPTSESRTPPNKDEEGDDGKDDEKNDNDGRDEEDVVNDKSDAQVDENEGEGDDDAELRRRLEGPPA